MQKIPLQIKKLTMYSLYECAFFKYSRINIHSFLLSRSTAMISPGVKELLLLFNDNGAILHGKDNIIITVT